MKKNTVIIPARGGSKRLKNKNILNFCGKPLISWTIDAAIQSKCIDRVIVSTDSQEIASISASHGAEVPFIRSSHLAADETTTSEVVLDAAEKLGLPDASRVVVLQPTTPLRTAKHIDDAIALFNSKKAHGVVSVSEVKHSPIWCNSLPKDNSMENFIDAKYLNKRSQDLPQFYSLNGAIYIYSLEQLRRNKGIFYSKDVYAFVMPLTKSIDIDDKIDFLTAELIKNYEDSLDVD